MTGTDSRAVFSADVLHDLKVLLRSRYGLVHLQTLEEKRVVSLLRYLAADLEIPLFRWSRLRGLALDGGEGPVYATRTLGEAFEHVGASNQPALYHFHGIGSEMVGDPVVADQLREAIASLEQIHGAIVVTDDAFDIPPGRRPLVASVSFPGPRPEDFDDLLRHIVRDLAQRQQVEVDLTREERATLVNHLAGLTLLEAEKILTKAIVEDGRLALADIQHVIDAKRSVVEREGLLEYYPFEETVAGVADLERLRAWLDKRKAVVAAPLRAAEFGLPFPRGVLLLGVPGCGKRLSSWSPPPTTSNGCRRSSCERGGSTRSSSSTCPMRQPARRYSAFIWKAAARTHLRFRSWSSPGRPTGSAVQRSNRW